MPAEPNDAAAGGSQPSGNSLRMALRANTRIEHELTEQAFEAFDVATSTGLHRFLLAHRAALQAVRNRMRGDSEGAREIAFMLDLIRADLTTLNDDGAVNPELNASPELNALGVRYVLLGSRLGSQLLAKRVSESIEKNLQRAGTYVSDRTLLSDWKGLLQALESPRAVAEAEVIQMSASETFALFRQAAEAIRKAAC